MLTIQWCLLCCGCRLRFKLQHRFSLRLRDRLRLWLWVWLWLWIRVQVRFHCGLNRRVVCTVRYHRWCRCICQCGSVFRW